MDRSSDIAVHRSSTLQVHPSNDLHTYKSGVQEIHSFSVYRSTDLAI